MTVEGSRLGNVLSNRDSAGLRPTKCFKNFVPNETVDTEFFYYLLLTQKQSSFRV